MKVKLVEIVWDTTDEEQDLSQLALPSSMEVELDKEEIEEAEGDERLLLEFAIDRATDTMGYCIDSCRLRK